MTIPRSASPDPNFWKGRRVLVTGHTGFKGSWLCLWLQHMGCTTTGLALPPVGVPNLFERTHLAEGLESHFCDTRDAAATTAIIRAAEPEIVFHLAAQPLVRASYRAPIETFGANVMGTAHVLDALRTTPSVKVAVMVTTDKVYRNREWVYPYREDDPLEGHDPYSASKAAAEIVVASYRNAFLAVRGIAVATARAGNVVGGGDWSEDRLIPDLVRSHSSGVPLSVRNPKAVRPWQHVMDVLAAYLVLAERLWADEKLAGAYNFGPATSAIATVRSLVELASAHLSVAPIDWGSQGNGPHEADLLMLETAKARAALGLVPRWDFAETVGRTMRWYKSFLAGQAARGLCLDDVEAFVRKT
jgi:CDP-glucose 4,6-dehydratase